MDLSKACEQEILGLHRFFEAWFNAGFADEDRGFRRFTDVMAPGFVIVSPRGVATALSELGRELRQAYGAWKHDGDDPWTIQVEDVKLRHQHGDVALLTYVEKQHARGHDTARLSTVLMERHDPTPNGVRWLHVHETWTPGGAPSGA